MREGIGSVFLYNIIIIFIVIVFAFLAGTMSYAKAFKVNSRIMKSIEIYEGYNKLAKIDIEKNLGTIGYQLGTSEKCPAPRKGEQLVRLGENYKYCVYYHPNDYDSRHYSYRVITYMRIDLPIIGHLLQIPISSSTRLMYYFKQ